MINLLPHTDREAVQKEYHLRVIAVALILTIVVFVIACILLVPSYLLTLYKNNVVENAVAVTPSTNDPAGFGEKVKAAKLIAGILRPNPATVLPTNLITLIFKDKGVGVDIRSLAYSQEETLPFTIDVRGLALNRQALLDFVHRLEREPGIASINLPVSSFAKDTNIEYSFTITQKP